jgi:hypothetical protein
VEATSATDAAILHHFHPPRVAAQAARATTQELHIGNSSWWLWCAGDPVAACCPARAAA